MKRNFMPTFLALTILLLASCVSSDLETITGQRDPVDYVNPYIGNISHLLVPTFPTIHLPN
ncbi:MAG: hypothetical protein RBS23_07985, partial [Mariniphaga sp.]|nr:hypothetical protein [Mariniphaga sp.]